MTNRETALAYMSTVKNTSVSADTRRGAAEALQSLKRSARVSYSRLGIDEDELRRAIENITETQVTQSEVTAQVEQDTQVTETASKQSDKRARAAALLADVTGKTRREQVQYLMDEMGINANSAYYFARVCQS